MSSPQPAKAGAPPANAGPQNYYATESTPPGTSYTRPPPAYDAAQSPLLGSPRNSEDNVPDDFKYSTSVGSASLDIRAAFVRKVYSILTVQLLLTALISSISFFSPSFKHFIQTNSWMLFLAMFGSLGLLLATYWKRKSYPANLLLLGGFTVMEAYTVATVVSFYEVGVVLQAVIMTGVVTAGMMLWACQSKYDYTEWYGYLYGALWFLLGFGLVAMFFPYSSTVELVYSGAGALLFSAYILVDTQLIMRRMHVEEEIAAAIALYLDIINLFLSILRIVNSMNDN